MISGAEINIVYYMYVKTQINPYSFNYSVQNKYMCILFEELFLPISWNFMTKHVPVYDEDNRSSLFKQRMDSLTFFYFSLWKQTSFFINLHHESRQAFLFWKPVIQKVESDN